MKMYFIAGMNASFSAHVACWTMNVALFGVPNNKHTHYPHSHFPPTCATANLLIFVCLLASKTPLLCLAMTFSH